MVRTVGNRKLKSACLAAHQLERVLVPLYIGWALLVLFLFLVPPTALGVASASRKSDHFLSDPSDFRMSLSLPVEDNLKKLFIPVRKLRARTMRYEKDERVEPVQLTMADNEVKGMARKLAFPDRTAALEKVLVHQLQMIRPNSSDSGKRTVTIDKRAFANIDPAALSRYLSKTHHKLTIESATLKQMPQVKKELLRQVYPFISRENYRTLEAKIKHNLPIEVDKELLPDFPQRMVGNYTVFRGPNCFHAAMAFHSEEFTNSPNFNVKREEGYHEVMINYDELWRILNTNFYEIKPESTSLKYGDVLIFFDVIPNTQISYRWIRHASTYLFGNYLFSKGSKSPNTPYSVKTIDEEWNTWKQYSKNLGVKVFRRGMKGVSRSVPEKLTEWLY